MIKKIRKHFYSPLLIYILLLDGQLKQA